MADYTVTVFDLAPGLVVMRYQPTVVPVDISLADLPSEPMELDHVHLYASVSNPSALTYVDLSIRVGAVYNVLVGADGLSPASGAWQMVMSPGAPANITGKYMTLPLDTDTTYVRHARHGLRQSHTRLHMSPQLTSTSRRPHHSDHLPRC